MTDTLKQAEALVALDWTPGSLDGTAPKRIWLQSEVDNCSGYRAGVFPSDHEGITWCEDSVGGEEVMYVRADLMHPLVAEHKRMAEELAQSNAAPVGEVFVWYSAEVDKLSFSPAYSEDKPHNDGDWQPLYTHPASPSADTVVEPTEAMCRAMTPLLEAYMAATEGQHTRKGTKP